MGENGNLEYKICFDLVENLDEYEGKPNYLGSVEYEENVYAITLDKSTRDKIRAENLVKYPFVSIFKDLFYTHLKASGRPIGHCEINEKLGDFEIIVEKSTQKR